jgi:hypothetical protein
LVRSIGASPSSAIIRVSLGMSHHLHHQIELPTKHSFECSLGDTSLHSNVSVHMYFASQGTVAQWLLATVVATSNTSHAGACKSAGQMMSAGEQVSKSQHAILLPAPISTLPHPTVPTCMPLSHSCFDDLLAACMLGMHTLHAAIVDSLTSQMTQRLAVRWPSWPASCCQPPTHHIWYGAACAGLVKRFRSTSVISL